MTSAQCQVRPRILVIDNLFGQTPDLRCLLQQQGFTVDVLPGLGGGVTAALFEDYRAVIVDIMLLASNGLDGLLRIRKMTELPMLVLTALGAENDRVAGLESGADDYVVKPYRPREVVARTIGLLRRWGFS